MVAVIGDIHGCYNTFKELVTAIKSRYPLIRIYTTGDLVDRGKFSCEAIDYALDNDITFALGNHDFMMYSFFTAPSSKMAVNWLYHPYEVTLTSYKNRFYKLDQHLAAIENAPLFINTPDCFISHAGISEFYKDYLPKNFLENPNKFLDIFEKDIDYDKGIIWARNKLLNIKKLQIVGHTRLDEIKIMPECNSVYIDTSAFAGNKLTAVIVENNELLEIIQIDTNINDIFLKKA